jgi:hypothetical protein
VRLVIGASSFGCQEILPAPYALSLRPGAIIHGQNTNFLTPSLAVVASDGTLDTAITAQVSAEDGYAGFFWNTHSNGAAIYAAGNIASSEYSYVWISGNDARKYDSDATTIIDANSYGGATIYGGTSWGSTQYVVLPVTITGPLYGQDVVLADLDVYWICSADLMGISSIRLRRRIDANSYANIVFADGGGSGYGCEDGVSPDGCTIHLDLTTNNVITADSGILYLVIGLNFASGSDWNRIDGVRLTLEHD